MLKSGNTLIRELMFKDWEQTFNRTDVKVWE